MCLLRPLIHIDKIHPRNSAPLRQIESYKIRENVLGNIFRKQKRRNAFFKNKTVIQSVTWGRTSSPAAIFLSSLISLIIFLLISGAFAPLIFAIILPFYKRKQSIMETFIFRISQELTLSTGLSHHLPYPHPHPSFF